jgi:hypothetical protein
MKKYTDKELADFLLEDRQHPDWKWRPYFKKNGRRWVFFICYIVLLFGFGIFAQSWWFCGFVFGLVFGMFSRDRVWLRVQQAVWPFYDKVIDWSKLEKIASGEPSA